VNLIEFVAFLIGTRINLGEIGFAFHRAGTDNTDIKIFSTRHSGVVECVVIVKTPHIRVFVIPGLTRNPVLFRSVTLLDAGSSPA
jgi:hypothetical protein